MKDTINSDSQKLNDSQTRAVITKDIYTDGVNVVGNMVVTNNINFTTQKGISADLVVNGTIDSREFKFSPNKIELGNSTGTIFRITHNKTTSTGYMQINPSNGDFYVNASNISGNITVNGEINCSSRISKQASIYTTWIQPYNGASGFKFSPVDSTTSAFRIYTNATNKIESVNNHVFHKNANFVKDFRLSNGKLPISFYWYELHRGNSSVDSEYAYLYNTGISSASYTVQPIGIISKFDVNEIGTQRRNDLWTYVPTGKTTWYIYVRKAWQWDPPLIRVRVIIFDNRIVNQYQSGIGNAGPWY